MKNREAARECRRKKKEYIKCLENRVAVLENQNKALIEELKSLKELYTGNGKSYVSSFYFFRYNKLSLVSSIFQVPMACLLGFYSPDIILKSWACFQSSLGLQKFNQMSEATRVSRLI